jgi:hypothetical protein
MEMSLVSSLTADDERRFAIALLRTISSLLDLFPIAYSVRITTLSGRAYTHTHAAEPALEATGPLAASSLAKPAKTRGRGPTVPGSKTVS